MDERILRFRVGVVVVAALLVLVSLIVMFGKGFQNNYTLFLRFREAPGVTTNTPVRKNGILIGRVSSVELVDEGVQLTVKIFSQYKIRQNQVPRIGTASLFGDAVIDFVPRSGEASTEEYQENTLIADGVVSRNPLEALDTITGLEDDIEGAISSIEGAGRSIETAGADVTTLARNVNNIVGNNEGQMRRILQKTELTLDNLNSTTQQVGGFLEGFDDDELKTQIKDTLANLRDASQAAKDTLKTAETSLSSFQEVGQTVQTSFANMDRNIEEL
ncbi:MAG: MlaD family protein, partial [bacterium]|nr:MlaD family protein [bacterium]